MVLLFRYGDLMVGIKRYKFYNKGFQDGYNKAIEDMLELVSKYGSDYERFLNDKKKTNILSWFWR